MKILHVVHNYGVIGGAELEIKSISEGLVKRGHQVTVLTSNAPSAEAYMNSAIRPLPAGTETINGVVVKRLPIFQPPRSIWTILDKLTFALWRRGWPLNDLARLLWLGPYVRGLTQQIVKSEADVLTAIPLPYLHVYRAFRAAQRCRLPMAVIPCPHPMDVWAFENPRHYRLLRKSQAVLAFTRYERDYLSSMGVPEERIHVIGCAINPADFEGVRRGEFRKKHLIADGEKVVLFVGRKADGKGLRPLLTAMKKVWRSNSRVKLVIAGSATEFSRRIIEPEIERLPDSIRGNVLNINDFEEAEKAFIYADCDIFVLPSKIESFGIVFLEAWMCGKPVIGCRTGPVASVVSQGQDGLLVPYGDAEELSQAITRLLADEGLCRKLGRNGREKVLRQYTWDRIVSRVESIYQALVQERGVYV